MSIAKATENAIKFARDALGPVRTAAVRLEEVASTEVNGKDTWVITLSMINPDDPLNSPIGAALGRGRREYKSFTVLKDSGEVTSMKIRELADA
ncbi:MAG TPA: hypothetical protein VN610_09510 [Bryobacteraceae bacterium]|nr:hypothetical protein [Bryobacteraceae bacterium]